MKGDVGDYSMQKEWLRGSEWALGEVRWVSHAVAWMRVGWLAGQVGHFGLYPEGD